MEAARRAGRQDRIVYGSLLAVLMLLSILCFVSSRVEDALLPFGCGIFEKNATGCWVA
jgi:hypothetical protein